MASLPRHRSLRVLHLEDSEVDHVLALAHLTAGGRAVQTLRVECESGFRAALEEDWDAILSDYNMPGRSGLDVLHVLKDEANPVKVLVVSMYPEDQYAIRALRGGAYGYVNKAGDPQVIVQEVRTVAQGRKYVTPEIAQMLVEGMTSPSPEHAHDSLSDRELQTLTMIASGKRLSDIAAELTLSPKTTSV